MSAWVCLVPIALLLAACGGGGSSPAPDPEPHPLDHLRQVPLGVGSTTCLVWLAETPAEQAEGLQGITEEQLAPLEDGTERGMLFVFPVDVEPGFWMRDTLVALDLAFLRSDGSIAEIHAMEPLDETVVAPSEPVRYALELRQGVFAAAGVGPDDVVDLTALAD